MKRILNLAITALILTIAAASCKKSSSNSVTPTNVLPAPVNNIISDAIIDTLTKHGAVVNKGTQPPTINGIFLIHPYVCSFDNSPGNFTGETFDDYKYQFTNQNNAAYSIRVDYLDLTDPTFVFSDSTATFISGNGSLFTIFSKFAGINPNGVNVVLLHVISGEVTSAGIKNFQNTSYLVSKGPDPNNTTEPAGTTRVFHDSDDISEPQSTFTTTTIVLP